MNETLKKVEEGKELQVLEDLARRIRNDVGEDVSGEEVYDIKHLVLLVKELNQKLDELKEMLTPRLKSTALELRKEEEILFLLSKYKTFTSSQLSGLMDLSRTRCNEYLKKLERKGILECVTIGRKKVYRIKDEVLNRIKKEENENNAVKVS
jgi:DNA-binding Lrp family transcriptional regulator